MSGRYCVVIPAFNAQDTIEAVVRCVKQQGLEVLIVDDGSRDQTASLASREGAVVISHLKNQGKGCALRTAFGYALRGGYDGVITMDGDGQHDPAEIPRLIRAAEHQHAALAIGDRMTDGVVMPPLRRWTNRVMSTLVSAVSRQPIPDSQCGFRLIRREVLVNLPLTATRFEIETELLLAAAKRSWKMISVPVRTIYAGQSSHIRPWRDGMRFLRTLLRYL